MRAQVVQRPIAAGQGGFALPAAIFSLAVLAILAVAALRSADDGQRSARAFREAGIALYAADAGLRKTLGAWPASQVTPLAPGDSLNLGWVGLPNHASYGAVIYRVDNGGSKAYAVVVKGRGAGTLGGQRTVTTLVAEVPQSVFKLALFGKDAVNLGGGSITDSWNSDAGAYQGNLKPAVYDSSGSIGSNGTISLTNTSTVNGDATAAGSTGTSGTVTGTRTDSAPPFPPMPTVPCPTGYSASVPGAGLDPKRSPIYYNPVTGQLVVQSGATLTLPASGGPYHFSSIDLSGNSKLVIDNSGGQHVDIYADANGYQDPSNLKVYGVNLSGGSVTNLAMNPKAPTEALPGALNLSACGNATRVPSSPTWQLSGNTPSSMTIYAPANDVTASGGSALFGAIVGKSITFSGGFKMHYDEALANAASNTPVLVVVPGSWTELTAF